MSIKFNFELICNYVLIKDETSETGEISHQTKMQIIDSTTTSQDLQQHYSNHCDKIIKKMGEFQERDSGWTLLDIANLKLNINKYECLKGSNYIKLPEKIMRKKACININNKDEYCFKWAIISALFKVKTHVNLWKSYHINDRIKDEMITLKNGRVLNFKSLKFPLAVNMIKIFEENNPDISVNVFGLEGDNVVGPFYFTQKEKKIHINLLLLEEDERVHYVWIKNISRLLRSRLTKRKCAIHVCNTCLIHFHNEPALQKHKEGCNKMVTIMPKSGDNILNFKNFKNQLDVPFVVYADFECILESTNFKNSTKVESVQKHIPYAYSYYIKCSFDSSLDKFRIYSGEDSPKHFFKSLVADTSDIYNNHLSVKKTMNSLTPSQERKQNEDTTCHICEKLLDNDRVADHCHLTGEYRGPAHNKCNLEYQIAKFIPIFFHNLSAYDCHLFIRELSSIKGDINIIPLNKELYISISKRISVNEKDTIELRFLDSFRFMASSLEKLASYLSDDDLNIVKSVYSNSNEFSLMKRKGVFPYDYIDSENRLQETQLPPPEVFFNKMTNESCSEEEYQHAENVWSTFQCKTLLDYLLLYLKADVLLLCDVFENFRKVCKNIYNLDPCQYYTTPGLSWDAMLKTTKIELELLTDINMYNFIVRGIRGGIVQCSNRHSIANNKYVSDYDSSKESNYLIYLDVNNLYGYAMSQYLPFKNFEWVENIENFNLNDIKDDSPIGYILEVDLDYPSSLHDYHNDLPFCAETKKIATMKQKKLITDLNNKTNYVIHYKNLQQCIENGLILKKIHRILKFNQSDWLKKYIDLNNQHRTLAKNSFEQNFFKLLNNAVYGKTMENVDKRKDIKIVSEWENRGKRLGARALIAKPNFHSKLEINENMVVIEMRRAKTVYNKPIYIGFSVLELSKWKMYNFHYDYMKPKYLDNINLNYMDTDSFIYDIRTNDLYDDIRNDITTHFDTSAYPKDNIYNIPLVNKKVLGMMKDECNGKVIKEFIGLRAKMYSVKIDRVEKEIKKIKGVKQYVTAKLSINNFRECLQEKKLYHDSMYIFRSKVHQIYTQHIRKLTLSYLDDKRFIRENGVETYAWGHYGINSSDSEIKPLNLSDNSNIMEEDEDILLDKDM
ncbi:uncharacterized protein LOC119600179 [Lucilia sericata]|uniref:uncharacterized protein LOC119600179 n=1 Tax=Lucilia sericata TaxID=13632 RepID=UPI0018A855ED|nr:uncharacterized protein LOC119600179 [Lucilia sericata]